MYANSVKRYDIRYIRILVTLNAVAYKSLYESKY